MLRISRRRPSARVTAVVSAVLSGALAVSAVVAVGLDVPAGTIVTAAYPTNAAKVFRWGDAQFNDEFHGSLNTRLWAVNKAGRVRNQHGMMTLNATSTSGTVAATMKGHGRQVGRWEARVRSKQYSGGATPYHVVWELVPTTASAYHCGARSIVLS